MNSAGEPASGACDPLVAFDAALLREPYSGVETLIDGTLRALARHGTLRCRCYAPAGGARPLPASGRLEVVPVAPARPRLRRILWEQAVLPRLLRRGGAQVLHAPAYVAPLAAPCPVALAVHDLHVYTHPRFCSAGNRLHYRLLLPAAVRRAAAVIVYTEHVRRQVAARFPGAAAKIAVIPPGVDERFLAPVPGGTVADVRARLRLPRRFLLFVGDLAPRKNLDGLLEAFRLLTAGSPERGDHLVLAGAAQRGTDARRLADRLGVSARVHATGYVAADDLPALYAAAEALVFPSHDEGFGLPALEAMACGCPAVVGPGGPAEVCGDAALVCDPASPASIAGAIRLLRDDPGRRAALVAAGRRRAAGFRWEQTIASLERVYRDAATAGRSARA
jgi:glycosyltransferase involved in cell wall biosynthesis